MVNGHYTKNELSMLGYASSYTKEELSRLGYTSKIVPINTLSDIRTSIVTNKKGEKKIETVYLLENIAIKKKGEEHYTLPLSFYRSLNGSVSQSATINYDDGKIEIVDISNIEEILSKENINRSLSDVWKSLPELNKMF